MWSWTSSRSPRSNTDANGNPMKTWLEPQSVVVPEVLRATVGGHPLVAEILARRSISDPLSARAFLDPEHYTPARADELPDIDQAVERIIKAVDRGETICVWGDFDVDGQTATTLLVATLHELGGKVIYHIPVRASEGHGVNIPALARLIDQGIGLLLTCDTGIAAQEAIDYARKRQVEVIVTDHHDPPPTLPNALAVINPKLLPAGHPLATLPGVGVAYKLAEALCQQRGRQGEADQHLDLVALGIVADIALLAGDTRYLLQRGLARLRQTTRPGLQAMLDLAEINPAWLNEEHIGYELGPRLNALGRLADANLAVEFLTTTDPAQARILATQLEGLNARRKLLTDQVFQGALTQIERDASLLHDPVLVLANPAWPAGIIGIVASRLVERYQRPVVLISAPPGQLARGSARSVEGCNITAAIAAHQHMLVGFGGHPMAAGLTIEPERIPEFRRALSRTVAKMLGDEAREETLQIDGLLPLTDLSLEIVADLERLAPFGPGNPAPILVSPNLSLKDQRSVGRTGEHLLLTVEDKAGGQWRVIWWQGAGWPLPEGRFDLAYRARATTYRGQRDLQIEWLDGRVIEEAPTPIQPLPPAIEVIDYRRQPQPLSLLEELQRQGEVQIWSEADHRKELAGRDRYELTPCSALAVWTTPPGRQELETVLERARPRTVYLFGVDPGLDHLERFLRRLAGLVKHALSRQGGRTRLSALAAATAQREATVRLGLAWLAARGHVVLEMVDDEIQLAPADGEASADLAEITGQLKALLQETAAYRAYFARADAEALL